VIASTFEYPAESVTAKANTNLFSHLLVSESEILCTSGCCLEEVASKSISYNGAAVLGRILVTMGQRPWVGYWLGWEIAVWRVIR